MSVVDRIPLNFELMKQPANWLILFLMVTIVGLAIALVSTDPASAGN